MTRAAVPLLLAALFVAACASQPSTPSAGDFCVSHAQFEASLDAFRALDPSVNTLDDYRAAWIVVQSAFRDMREHGFELADDLMTEVNQAIDDLQRALDDIPDGTDPADAVASLEDELAAVSDAVGAMNSVITCPA